jgi:signal transduction histidine kinase
VSATARRRGAGEKWDLPAVPVVPDVGKEARQSEQPETEPASTGPAHSAETLKRRLTRLALDVHDGPMQNLAVIGFSLGDLRRRMHAVVPEEHHTNLDAGMEQLSAELVRVESELRGLISALEHGNVSSVPVVDAVESEISAFEKISRANVAFEVSGHVETETDSQRIAIQSVTRAALANIAKHASATNVEVSLSGTPHTITLQVTDDGAGFDSTAPPKDGRFGLVGMKERVELLGGRFELSSRPGGPTRITATLQTWRPEAT